MKLFGFNITNTKPTTEVREYDSYSSPLGKVGEGNLSTPYINSAYQFNGFVPFGEDNLFPQLLNQLYYVSPLHGSIINFKSNAAVGGGYTFNDEKLTNKEKVELKAFEIRNKVNRLNSRIAKELEIHGRFYVLGTFRSGKMTKLKLVCPTDVRINKTKTKYFISEDYAMGKTPIEYSLYEVGNKDGVYILEYDRESIGSDIYTIPQYSSANNWIFLDGEMSYLHKSNILNSVFPSFAFMFPKRPQSEEEKNEIRTTINKLKGAENTGKGVVFFANTKDQLPDIKTLPVNNNDKLFLQTTESIDGKITQVHQIDPILMGIRVSGKLGSGSDIKQSYIIFEKNVINPLRNEVEQIINSLLYYSGIKTTMTLNSFNIIENEIVQTDENGDSGQSIDAINSMSPLVATKVLDSLTEKEIRALGGFKPKTTE